MHALKWLLGACTLFQKEIEMATKRAPKKAAAPVSDDPFDGVKAIVSADKLDRIKTLAQAAVAQEKMIEEMERAVSEAKNALIGLTRHDLPNALKEVGMKDFTLEDGSKIVIKDYVSGSIPKEPDAREAAMEWLEDDEEGVALIKTELSLKFGVGKFKQAAKLADDLRKKGFVVDEDTSVHSASLQSFARERLANGGSIPLELLGLTTGSMAKITLPKPKKAKGDE